MSLAFASKPSTFDDEAGKKVADWKKELAEADALVLKLQEKLYQPLWAKRAEIVASVENFWPQAISNCEAIAPYFDDVDAPLIAKLKDVKVHRDAEDPRGAKIEFVFHDNDFLAENTLVKEFVTKPDSNPLGSEDFDWADDLEPKPSTIQWKSDEVNLCKKKPTATIDDEDDAFEPGSFFSSFFESTSPQIANGIGQAIVNTFYPSVIEWYTGEAIGAFGNDFEDDMFDSEEEDDVSDDEEIDLEEAEKKSKKPKTEK